MNAKRVVMLLVAVLCGTGMVMGQTEWVDHPDNPLIGPGEPGSWDATGHQLTMVVFDGSIYHMWFNGYDGNGATYDIGHATSPDGLVWTIDPANPVLTRGANGEWDDDVVLGGGVIHDGTLFHMWYSGLHGGIVRAGKATSPDGTVWTKHPDNPVMDVGPPGAWDELWVYPTTVIVDDSTYQMWYVGHDGSLFQTGYAESSNGIDWDKRPEPVLEIGTYPGAWDATNAANPCVIFDGSTYHMWYTGGSNSLSIGYAYSSDGIQWTKHRDNPIAQSTEEWIYAPRVILDGSTYRIWYSHWDGSVDLISYATSTCCAGVPGLNNWQFIPAAAVASGAQGAFFQTDVDVSNAGGQAAEYQFRWLPRGEDNSEPTTSGTFSLDAGKSSRYANVLAEVFDLEPDSLGALAIMSTSPDLLAMSRTYNLPGEKAAGTYGQAFPAMLTNDFIQYGEPRRILFASEHADLRTNIGCQNGTSDTTVVYLDLYNSAGSPLGRKVLMLRALGNDQVNRIFDGHQPVNGYVDVSVAQAGNLVYCYGSVLDNVTSDPTTIPPQ